MYDAEDWKKQTRLTAVGVSDQAEHLVLVLFLVVIEKFEIFFTESAHVVLTEAVLQNLAKVFCVWHLVWLVRAKRSGCYLTNLVFCDGILHETPCLQ